MLRLSSRLSHSPWIALGEHSFSAPRGTEASKNLEAKLAQSCHTLWSQNFSASFLSSSFGACAQECSAPALSSQHVFGGLSQHFNMATGGLEEGLLCKAVCKLQKGGVVRGARK